jgi:chaperonin GroES
LWFLFCIIWNIDSTCCFVVAIGNKVEDVKVGDTIVFEQYRGTEFKLEGEEYLILNIENVIGVM